MYSSHDDWAEKNSQFFHVSDFHFLLPDLDGNNDNETYIQEPLTIKSMCCQVYHNR